MPNKLKVLVVGKVGKSAAYEIAGVVSSEMGCDCQADVEVKAISDTELKAIISLLHGWRGHKVDPTCVNEDTVGALIKKLTPSPIEDEDEE